MASVTLDSTAEDGYINTISGIYNSEVDIIASTSSSSGANENQAFFFFNTNGVLPAGAIIDSVTFKVWCLSVVEDAPDDDYWTVEYSNTGEMGSTLDGTDWNKPSSGATLITEDSWSTGLYTSIDATAQGINQTGYTNVVIKAHSSGASGISSCEAHFSASEGTHVAQLVIVYHLPGGGGTLPMMGVG